MREGVSVGKEMGVREGVDVGEAAGAVGSGVGVSAGTALGVCAGTGVALAVGVGEGGAGVGAAGAKGIDAGVGAGEGTVPPHATANMESARGTTGRTQALIPLASSPRAGMLPTGVFNPTHPAKTAIRVEWISRVDSIRPL